MGRTSGVTGGAGGQGACGERGTLWQISVVTCWTSEAAQFQLTSGDTCKIRSKNHFRNHRYLLNPPESLGRGAAQLLVGGGEGGPAKAHTGADHLAPAKAVLVLPCPSSVIRLIPESSGVKILICGTSNLAALAAMMHSRKWIYTCSLCLPNTRMLRLITATLRSGAPVSGSAL